MAYNGADPVEDDPEGPPVEKFRELHRLSYTVKVFGLFGLLFCTHTYFPTANR